MFQKLRFNSSKVLATSVLHSIRSLIRSTCSFKVGEYPMSLFTRENMEPEKKMKNKKRVEGMVDILYIIGSCSTFGGPVCSCQEMLYYKWFRR